MGEGRTSYDERFERVSRYIYEHLDEDIDLTRLAEVAALSPYHWHRIYEARRGESVTATVRRLRLHRAAGELANSDRPIATIANRAGYGEVASFTRAFSCRLRQPPAEYRRAGSLRVGVYTRR